MAINIIRLSQKTFPEKTSVCGSALIDERLLMTAHRSRTEWIYNKLKTGIIVNTAVDYGEIIGQITALPLSESPVELEGENYWYIPCIWMAPKNASPILGEYLLSSVVEDLADKRVGLVTLSNDVWINHRSFLERFGFKKSGEIQRVSRKVDIMLLDSPQNDAPPSIIPRKNKPSEFTRLDFYFSPHCPMHTITQYRLIVEHSRLRDSIPLIKHDVGSRKEIESSGYSFALLLDGSRDILHEYLSGESLASLIGDSI